jgi:hypothetical protein
MRAAAHVPKDGALPDLEREIHVNANVFVGQLRPSFKRRRVDWTSLLENKMWKSIARAIELLEVTHITSEHTYPPCQTFQSVSIHDLRDGVSHSAEEPALGSPSPTVGKAISPPRVAVINREVMEWLVGICVNNRAFGLFQNRRPPQDSIPSRLRPAARRQGALLNPAASTNKQSARAGNCIVRQPRAGRDNPQPI